MISIKEAELSLKELGVRVRHSRVARNESMALFADRIGVSVPTLRDIEKGRPTVQVGHWARALWALGALESVDRILAPEESLFDRVRAKAPARLRPYRRMQQPKP